jgi:hypothetical protein
MANAMHEGDSYRLIEVITGERPRRQWTVEEKARIVAESFEEGANISEVALFRRLSELRQGFSDSMIVPLYKWRVTAVMLDEVFQGAHDIQFRQRPAGLPDIRPAVRC